MWLIISWVFIGLVAGALGKLLMPGDDPGGIFVTILLGIAGAILGGYLGTFIGMGEIGTFSFQGLLLAIGGTIILLFGYRLLKARK